MASTSNPATTPRSPQHTELLALEFCNSDPIRFIDSIQPHGVVISLRYPELEILQVSANAEALLHQPLAELIGHPLAVVFAEADVELLRQRLGQSRASAYLTLSHPATEQSFAVSLYWQPGMLLMELEPQPPDQPSSDQLCCQINTAIAAFSTAPNLQALVESFAHEIQQLTGFDRVMVYGFKPDQSGVVLAEVNTSDRENYLGLHFPATDIPGESRTLFYENPLRFIPDLSYSPVPLVPAENSLTHAPLDLGSVELRGVSPPHIDYLQNMGVSGSLTLSLNDDQSLWGLIACHHYQPKPLPKITRMAFRMLAKVASLELMRHQERDRSDYQNQNKTLLTQLDLATNETEAAVLHNLTANASLLLEMFEAEGVALVLDQDYALVGRTPTQANIQDLVAWLADQQAGQVFATQCLTEIYPACRHWSVL